ncbi:MAG: hypothetical protein U9R27_08550 [Campylobacterota bacterium]|nr:hypothetical protein [Campylobacterota bacterium]
MKKLIGLTALGLSMILLSGCGSDSDTPIVEPTLQGAVIGSYYEGARVCVDTNSNDRCDGEESVTVSDANGNWRLDNRHNNAFQVVAEIYVDSIKHSPSGSTLVEKPMIFIAPIRGEVDGQLIVSPISTMVYRYMQDNGTSFEVARESVAKELGVSSDTLLTNYSVENPSADHTTLQERSEIESEKLGLGMSYHDNIVEFQHDDLQAGRYVVKDYYIPSAQDPDHHVKIGTVANMDVYSDEDVRLGYFTFRLGRKGSTNVADWWKHRVDADQNVYGYDPDKLNFAMRGDLTMTIGGKNYIFSDFYLAQGHFLVTNPWWIGSRECSNIKEEIVICSGKDENGNRVKIQFNNYNPDEFLIFIK